MLYYFGGKFSPITKGHYNVLGELCKSVEKTWNPNVDKIVIGITELNDGSGIKGHMLCSSEEYRMEMIENAVCDLKEEFPFLKGKDESNEQGFETDEFIEIVFQSKKYTYEFIKEYCKENKYTGKITLVLGEDEANDLRQAVVCPDEFAA